MSARRWFGEKRASSGYMTGVMIVAAGILGYSVMIPISSRDRFIAPGNHSIRVGGPETLVIFHEYVSDFGGGRYNTKGKISGLTCRVYESNAKEAVPIAPMSTATVYEIGGNLGEGLCSFQLPVAGEYIVDAQYGDSQATGTNAAGVAGMQAVLAIGQEKLSQYRHIGRVFLILCLAIGGIDIVQKFMRRRQRKSE